MKTDLHTQELGMEQEWEKIFRAIHNLKNLKPPNFCQPKEGGPICYKKLIAYNEIFEKLSRLDEQAEAVRIAMISEFSKRAPLPS